MPLFLVLIVVVAEEYGQFILTGVSDDEIKYTDATFQNDKDASFKILSTSPGVRAKFSSNGEELIVRGNGDVTLRLKWSDDPKENGQAVGELKIAGKTFRQRGKSGEQVETIKVSGKTIDKLSKRGNDSNNITILPPKTSRTSRFSRRHSKRWCHL